ncbi:MAG: hypothetical protein Q8O09_00305 [Bacillota bacterium]|nr:hypothetical protein [Bacillota bacterium]
MFWRNWCGGKRWLGLVLIIIGVLIICIFIPVWVWCIIFGIALILLGIFFWKCRAR